MSSSRSTLVVISALALVALTLAFLGYSQEQEFHRSHCQPPAPKLPASQGRCPPCASCSTCPKTPECATCPAQKKEECPAPRTVYVDVAKDPFNYTVVLKQMRYWRGSKYARQVASIDKYLLFDIDCGGFNNIRMAFEYHVIWAWLTHRTLVLPPIKGWYLLDWGPITVLAHGETKAKEGTVSRFGDYFDMDSLGAAVPVISTREWLELPEHVDKVPEHFKGKDVFDFDLRRKYFEEWLMDPNNPIIKLLKFRALAEFVYWPNKEEVMEKNPPSDSFVDHREGREVSEEMLRHHSLYHPTCQQKSRYRSLQQVAVAVAFSDDALYKAMLSVIRDNLHLHSAIFEYAAEGVAQMGMWKYSALHVRRNDLQYKQVFLKAEQTLDHVKALLKPNEPLYLATDEFSPDFFKAFTDAGHKVTRIQDLEVFKKVPRKLLGMVEMAICACGRTFFGTRHSTFTAYIHRLRGYMEAPDTKLYWHNIAYTGNVEEDDKKRPPTHGQGYMEEHPVLWEAIQEER